MEDIGLLAFKWSLDFLSQLHKNGVTDCIISPGSRSTPLVLAVACVDSLKKRIVIDERSAAFQALGITKATARPVVLICTSGTAAANYFPAIVEANLSRVPLIVITADRPSKLRNMGVQQTIDQVKLYGNHAQYVELSEPNSDDLKRIPKLANQVFYESLKGFPIHVNAAFRKPLQPKNLPKPIHIYPDDVHFNFPKIDLTDLKNELSVAKKPLFIFGPCTIPSVNFSSVFEWGNRNSIPCITEILSQITPNQAFTSSFLTQPETKKYFKPDLIVRFGRQTVSSVLNQFLGENKEINQIHFDYFDVWHDATFTTAQHYFGRIEMDELNEIPTFSDENWFELWSNAIQENKLRQVVLLNEKHEFSEAQVFRQVSLWNKFDGLHLSNSYPIRDSETFGDFQNKKVYCNRGANGIDGVISTALGNSVSHPEFCTLIGDIAFLHDATSLVNHIQYHSNHTLLVINNGGGQIFGMLPISKMSDTSLLKTYFTTAQTYKIECISKAFSIPFYRVETREDFNLVLNKDFSGLRIIECVVNAEITHILRKKMV